MRANQTQRGPEHRPLDAETPERNPSEAGKSESSRPSEDAPAKARQAGSWTLPLAGACLAALVTLAMTASPPQLPPAATVEVDTIGETTRLELKRVQFFDDQVTPLIAELDAENEAAAERCIARIEETIQGYRDGVGPFAKDLTSLSTRLGIIKRMPGGWWTEDDRVENYVEQKFAQHLFSEEDLAQDISAALVQFKGEITVNQNITLTQIQAALTTADLPGVQLQQSETFFRELSTNLGDYAAGSGTTSVENMIAAFVMGEVGAFAARSVVAGLLTRFAPSVAIASAAGASATVGASATGAGGGSLGGPIGTVVGFGAGLAVGLVIDWWMTERFETQLVTQMQTYLDDLERTLLDGSVIEASQASSPTGEPQGAGLRQALPRFCEQLRSAYRDRFFEQIVLGDSP